MKQLTPLDPQSKAFVDRLGQGMAADTHSTTIEETRAGLALFAQSCAGPKVEVGDVRDVAVPGPGGSIPVRIYSPFDAGPDDALPCAFYFHGGGYIFGDLDSEDQVPRRLCRESGIRIISVAYRLAPEHRFPAAVEDCYAAVSWVCEHGAKMGVDPARIAVVGQSVGGTLAITTCMRARDLGEPDIHYHVVVGAPLELADASPYPSRKELGDGTYFVSEQTYDLMRRFYLTDPESDAIDPLASPLRASDFSRLPTALVIVPEYDPSRDENLAYVHNLAEAGVQVEFECLLGTIHGVIVFDGILDRGRDLQVMIAHRLRDSLSAA